GLIGMAHRTTYVMQGTIANASHMIEGFIRGLKARRPALINLYSSCQPEHGIGDDMSAHQAKLAVESRAYPVFRYDPAAGKTPAECFDLEGNPALDQDWPTYKLKYRSGNRDKEMEVPLTFADFAITEARFRKHYRIAPPDTWNENMVPLVDFLDLDAADREGKYPYIWSVDRKQQLSRLLVDSTIVESCEDRRDFWTMLRALAGVGKPEISREEIEAEVRRDLAGRIGAALVDLAGGGGGALGAALAQSPASGDSPASGKVGTSGAASDHLSPWLDTEQCTACDECMRINPKIFAYNAAKKAYIQNPAGGPYQDLVKAAEKCTARVIHPGLPKDRSAKDVAKWIARGEKYN
ncbi:MAG: ferredoxin, partial [Thermoanaerobaculia bacterium]|nr:ferredoxin [Thermoanaerobaculia bacterium]